MLIEHTIEPEFILAIIHSKRNCNDFFREFERPSPRVIAEIPKIKRFRDMVHQYFSSDLSEVEKKRLEELFEFILTRAKLKIPFDYNDSIDYMQNISNLDKHNFNGNHLVVKKSSDQLNKNYISLEDFENGLASLPYQLVMERQLNKFKDALKNFCRLSSHITVVEPYFSDNKSMWNSFTAILEISDQQSPISKKVITVLYRNIPKGNTPSAKFLMDKLKKEKTKALNGNISKIIFKEIKETGSDIIHNRYLLSELAGIQLGAGISTKLEKATDDVSLLDKDLYKLRFNQYVNLDSFDVVDEACWQTHFES